MASPNAQLTAALRTIDNGLAQLANGFTAFRDANQIASRRVYQTRGRDEVFTREQAMGATRLLELIVRRMRTLGLGAVLDQARTQGGLEDTVSAVLAPRIGDVADVIAPLPARTSAPPPSQPETASEATAGRERARLEHKQIIQRVADGRLP